jgi:hypothetical protein
MSDFGEAKFILGMKIVRKGGAGTISLSQEHYTKEILEKYGILDNTPSKVPMAHTHYRDREVAFDHEKGALSPLEHETFRDILGQVDNSCMCTIPDIAFAVSVTKRWQTTSTQMHMKHLKRFLHYLSQLDKANENRLWEGIFTNNNTNDIIKAFSDSDRATYMTTRRSQSGEVVMLNGGGVN